LANETAIEWTDLSWNPVHGCSKLSPGCAHCYAETLSRRYRQTLLPWTPENAAQNVILKPHKLKEPLSNRKEWREPKMVFVNSTSDLFHELVPDEFIAEVFAVMACAPQHTFQVLTKRPERMATLLADVIFWQHVLGAVQALRQQAELPSPLEMDGGGLPQVVRPLPNCWLGTSIENRRYVWRADALRETPAAVRFISAEPLLGPLIYDDFKLIDPCNEGYARWSDGTDIPELDLTSIDWLIVGGESGPGHRPMNLDWVRDLRDAALATNPLGDQRLAQMERPALDPGPEGPPLEGPGSCHPRVVPPHRVRFFFKQVGGATSKAGGRELDGRTWSEMPEVARG
jgi:protein gp37